MLETAGKIIWFLITGAFALGAWSATLEYRVQDQKERQEKIEASYQADTKVLIDVLGRMDERLKHIERK